MSWILLESSYYVRNKEYPIVCTRSSFQRDYSFHSLKKYAKLNQYLAKNKDVIKHTNLRSSNYKGK